MKTLLRLVLAVWVAGVVTCSPVPCFGQAPPPASTSGVVNIYVGSPAKVVQVNWSAGTGSGGTAGNFGVYLVLKHSVTLNDAGATSVTVRGQYATGGTAGVETSGGQTFNGVTQGATVNIDVYATVLGVNYWIGTNNTTASTLATVQIPTLGKQYQLSLTNSQNFPMVVNYFDPLTGDLVGSVTLPPNSTQTATITNNSGGGLNPVIATTGYYWGPSGWTAGDPGTTYYLTDTPIGNGLANSVGANGMPNPSSSTPLVNTPSNVGLGTGGGGSAVLGNVPFSATQLNDSTGLTNGVFSQGANGISSSVNKADSDIVAALAKQTLNVDLTPVTTAITGTNSKLDAVNVNLTQTNSDLDDIKKGADEVQNLYTVAGYHDGYGTTDAQAAGTAAVANAAGAAGSSGTGWGIGGDKGIPGAPTAGTVPAEMEATPPGLTLAFGSSAAKVPVVPTSLATLASWMDTVRTTCKNITLWGFVLAFIWAASDSCIDQGKTLMNLQPWGGMSVGPENVVPMGAQAKHTIIATAAVLGIVAAWGLIIGVMNTQFAAAGASTAGMFDLASRVGTFAGDVGNGIALAGAWFPIRGVLQLGLSYFLIKWGGFGTVMATAIYMKFLAGCVVVGVFLSLSPSAFASHLAVSDVAVDVLSVSMSDGSNTAVLATVKPGCSLVQDVASGTWTVSTSNGQSQNVAIGVHDILSVTDTAIQVLPDGELKLGTEDLFWAFFIGFGTVVGGGVVLFVFMGARKGVAMAP